ncbi:putative reverse transcriptase domain-containing protein [Tanacetum coccineum]
MAPTTRGGPNTPVNDTNPNNMTPESIQAMIDQALLRNATNGDGSHSSHGDNRRNVQTARPCFYADFMKCRPLNFMGAEGVWNGQIRTLGPEAYAMTWEVLKKKMTDKYYPQGEIKKLDIELWNLKVKGNDVPAIMNVSPRVNPDMYQICCTMKPRVDKYIETPHYEERQSDNKRGGLLMYPKQPWSPTVPFQKAEVAKVLQHGDGRKESPYGDPLPKRQRCNSTQWPCPEGNGATPKGNGCFECGAPGHFKRDCPKLKNKDGGKWDRTRMGLMQLGMRKDGKSHQET